MSVLQDMLRPAVSSPGTDSEYNDQSIVAFVSEWQLHFRTFSNRDTRYCHVGVKEILKDQRVLMSRRKTSVDGNYCGRVWWKYLEALLVALTIFSSSHMPIVSFMWNLLVFVRNLGGTVYDNNI